MRPPILGAFSNTSSATTQAPPDTTPPSAPGTLTTSAASSTQIDLSWGAATDNVGVTGYRVERCAGAGCSSFAQIAAPAGTSFNDTGLTASTSYSYRVRAVDAATNAGAFSNTSSATTLAPSVDSGLDTRPSNLTCIAPPRTVGSSTMTIDGGLQRRAYRRPSPQCRPPATTTAGTSSRAAVES